LLREPELVEQIVKDLVYTSHVPVSVKIRVLEEGIDATVDFAKRMQDCGVSMLTLHGRTVKQNKQMCGASDWNAIKRVKDALEVPVVGNGGVETTLDALKLMEFTGCDAVMSSEALLENPAIFHPKHIAQAQLVLTGGKGINSNEEEEESIQEHAAKQLSFAFEYMELVSLYPPVQGQTSVKGHLFKMLHRLLSVHPDLRSTLALAKSKNWSDIMIMLEELCKRYSIEHEANSYKCFPSSSSSLSVLGKNSYYRRYR